MGLGKVSWVWRIKFFIIFYDKSLYFMEVFEMLKKYIFIVDMFKFCCLL